MVHLCASRLVFFASLVVETLTLPPQADGGDIVHHTSRTHRGQELHHRSSFPSGRQPPLSILRLATGHQRHLVLTRSPCRRLRRLRDRLGRQTSCVSFPTLTKTALLTRALFVYLLSCSAHSASATTPPLFALHVCDARSHPAHRTPLLPHSFRHHANPRVHHSPSTQHVKRRRAEGVERSLEGLGGRARGFLVRGRQPARHNVVSQRDFQVGGRRGSDAIHVVGSRSQLNCLETPQVGSDRSSKTP